MIERGSILIPRLPADSFDWSRWRAFNLFMKFNFACRTTSMIAQKDLLLECGIGYIEANKLLCRPKENAYAVMILDDNELSWFHMLECEFREIFCV